MTADRPYRTPLTSDQAISELRRCSGSQFDPTVTEAFITVRQARDATAARPASRPGHPARRLSRAL